MSNEQMKEWELIAADVAEMEHLQSKVNKWSKKFTEKHRKFKDGAIVQAKYDERKDGAAKAKVLSAEFDYRTGQILYTIAEQWRAQTWVFGESLLVEVVE